MPYVADFVLDRLRQWGVHRVFAYPGDVVNRMLGAFERAKGDPEFIQPRHEEMGAFMACAHAKFTGEVGRCMATSGPGAIHHLLNGLYDAKVDHRPVVAILGQQKRISLGAQYQQEVALECLFAAVSEYVQTIMHPAQARQVIDRVFKTALSMRGVAAILIPEDVQEEPAETSPPKMHGAVYTSVGWSKPRVLPNEDELRHAADILNQGGKVAMLIGQGAAQAGAEVIEAAELLGAGVAKARLGRDAVPDDLPFVTGPIGLLGSKSQRRHDDELRHAVHDRYQLPVLAVAARGGPGPRCGNRHRRAAHRRVLPDGCAPDRRCERDAARTHPDAQTQAGPRLAGTDREGRAGVATHLRRPRRAGVRRENQPAVGGRDALATAAPPHPHRRLRFVHQLVGAPPHPARGHAGLAVGHAGHDGPGVPYAIAAKFAYPDRPVIAFVGGGAFQMNGMNEMITAMRYADRLGGARFAGSQAVPDVPYARYAQLPGLHAIYCDDPARVGHAWDEALSGPGPVVLELKMDCQVPPVPPHIMYDLAKKATKGMLKDSEKVAVGVRGFRQELGEFYEALPGRDQS